MSFKGENGCPSFRIKYACGLFQGSLKEQLIQGEGSTCCETAIGCRIDSENAEEICCRMGYGRTLRSVGAAVLDTATALHGSSTGKCSDGGVEEAIG